MFALFNRFKKPIEIEGKSPEKIVLTRVGKSSSSNFKSNFVFTGLLEEDTKLENGDIFKCKVGAKEETFMVVSVRIADESTQATVYKCNGVASIYRAGEKQYDENDNLIGGGLTHIIDIPTNHMTVNSSLRQIQYSGYLPSTTKEFRIPKCDIKLLDRIVLDGKNFCVDSIDSTKFDGLLAVQTSDDNRTLE